MRRISLVLLATALLGAGRSDALDTAPAGAKSGDTCFLTSEFENWRPSADAKNIFVRVGRRRFLRLELAKACPMLHSPNARLITRWRGPTVACNAIDWDLSVSQGGSPGFPIPCVVQKVHAMTADEVAALPKGQRP
jgi:hypothetical protein